MSMKKFIAIGAIVLGFYNVQASWLYWQINGVTKDNSAVYGDWTVANLYIRTANGAKVGDPIQTAIGDDDGWTGLKSIDLSTIQGVESYSFYVELMNDNDELMGYTVNQQTYASLKNAGSIVDVPMEIPEANIWHGGTFAAPEPTSGVLMLLGVAGLALRRKQRKSE